MQLVFRLLRRFFLALLMFATPRHLVAQNLSSPYQTRFFHGDTTSDVVMPILSFVLPGLDQYVNGQFEYATIYSVTALAGDSYASASAHNLPSGRTSYSYESKNTDIRKYLFGLQTRQAMGGLSLFHSFRTAVTSRQPKGQYSFINTQDTPPDILFAPFECTNILRFSTWMALATGAIVNAWTLSHPSQGYEWTSFQPSDSAFTFGFSYNAATHEEAMFRGWLMPVAHEYGMSEEWSNVTQAIAFALAHANQTSLPLVQGLLGYHLGRVTQENHWSIREATFIHFWWDIMAFATQYHLRQNDLHKSPGSESMIQPASLVAPPLYFNF